VFTQQLRVGIPQHLDQEGVDVRDLPCVSIENEDPVLGGLEEPAVTGFRRLQGGLGSLALGGGGFYFGYPLAQGFRLGGQFGFGPLVLSHRYYLIGRSLAGIAGDAQHSRKHARLALSAIGR
jgi:hypothetical protein